MGLREQAALDIQDQIDRDNELVSFESPDGSVTFDVMGQFTRIDAPVDPQTAIQSIAPKAFVTVSIRALQAVQDKEITELPTIPDEGWFFSTTDVKSSGTLSYVVTGAPRIDHTLGFVSLNGEAYEQDG